MNFQKLIFLSVLTLLLCQVEYAYSIPAFPGAEGYGINTVGGRGGTVIKVMNLNDSGTGSLRAAVTASGPRIVVFEVSGIINLASTLAISNPYITIAGQTSPGGILVGGGGVKINTHDVIIQHIRFRVGTNGINYKRDGSNNIIYYNKAQWQFPPKGNVCQGTVTTEVLGYPCAISGGADPETLDTLSIYGNSMPSWFPNTAYNIIIDHCSISWGVDENFDIGVGATDITIQWSIISEGLSKAGHPKGEHSKGLLVSGKYTNTRMMISLHHNYFAHNIDRNPMIQGAHSGYNPDVLVDVVNNVVYNFKGNLSMITQSNGGKVNWIHNYVSKKGHKSNNYAFEAVHFPDTNPPLQMIYVKGNIGSRRFNQTEDEWSVGLRYANQKLDHAYQKTEPWPIDTGMSVTTSVITNKIAECIVKSAGATAPVRDSVDTRVIHDFFKGTGAILNNVTYPADYPSFLSPAPPADADNDGMADSWELSNGLNTSSNDSALDKDGDGYTNIEEYLNYLSAKSLPNSKGCM